MIETFVLMELARQLTWSSERARLYHYRTKDQVEVDVILESPNALIRNRSESRCHRTN